MGTNLPQLIFITPHDWGVTTITFGTLASRQMDAGVEAWPTIWHQQQPHVFVDVIILSYHPKFIFVTPQATSINLRKGRDWGVTMITLAPLASRQMDAGVEAWSTIWHQQQPHAFLAVTEFLPQVHFCHSPGNMLNCGVSAFIWHTVCIVSTN